MLFLNMVCLTVALARTQGRFLAKQTRPGMGAVSAYNTRGAWRGLDTLYKFCSILDRFRRTVPESNKSVPLDSRSLCDTGAGDGRGSADPSGWGNAPASEMGQTRTTMNSRKKPQWISPLEFIPRQSQYGSGLSVATSILIFQVNEKLFTGFG
jgi:hypothetical protein